MGAVEVQTHRELHLPHIKAHANCAKKAVRNVQYAMGLEDVAVR